MTPTDKLLHSALTEKIIGVYYEVYNELGYGFLESVYRESMCIALRDVGLTVEQEIPVPVMFRGNSVGDYRADLLVENSVIVELKAVRTLEKAHEAQLHHYLRATPVEVGLLFNFGAKPEFKRLCYLNSSKRIRSKVPSSE